LVPIFIPIGIRQPHWDIPTQVPRASKQWKSNVTDTYSTTRASQARPHCSRGRFPPPSNPHGHYDTKHKLSEGDHGAGPDSSEKQHSELIKCERRMITHENAPRSNWADLGMVNRSIHWTPEKPLMRESRGRLTLRLP
jgi:hypothetical protein